jgi:glyoxylase-like metal-dependent hydrolase (beta-lactamase superfamily II)
MPLQIHTIVSMPFQENTYIVWCDDRADALVIDPGLEPDGILEFLDDRQLQVAAILNTHGHADHIAGNEAMKQRFPNAPLLIGVNETALLTDAELNMSAAFGFAIVSPPADHVVHEGDAVEFAGVRLEVREIPGHSPGHVVFLVRPPLAPGPTPAAGRGEKEPIVVFGGDVLFRGSIGRTDFGGGSFDVLAAGIRTKLYTLPDDTVVYPGHGPTTTTGHEKRTNAFVKIV